MAATSVLKLVLDDKEYSASIKEARKGMVDLERALHDAGKSFSDVDKSVLAYAKEIGNMNTVAKESKGQLREMSQTLTELTRVYRQLSDQEKSSEFGKGLLESIDKLTERAGEIQDAMGDVQASIKNAASDTRAFDQVAGGFSFMVSGLQTAQGAAKLLGIEFGNDLEIVAKLQAAMAVTSGLQQVQAMLQKQSALMQGIVALQTRFNFLAKMNPYALLATAVATVAGAFALFSDSADDARQAQEKLNKEIEDTKWQLQEIGNNADFDARIAEAAGASWEEIHKIRLEAAKLQEELAYNAWSNAPLGSEFKEQREQLLAEWDKARSTYDKIFNEGLIDSVARQHHTGRYARNAGGGGGGRIRETSTSSELLPQYSVAGLTEDLKYLQQEQQKATSPEEWRTYADAIRGVEDEIMKLKGELSSLGTSTDGGISISGILSEKLRKDQAAFKNQKLNVSPVERQGQVVSVGQTLGSLAGGMNQIAGGIEQLGIDIPEGFNKAIGVMQAVAAILTGISTVVTIIAAIQGTKAIPVIGWALARGGVVKAAGGYTVPGNNYSNDMVPALLNSGELVLNKAQQGNLASQLSTPQGGYAAQPYVNGEMILLGTNNYLGRSGQGEVVTTKMLRSMGLMK